MARTYEILETAGYGGMGAVYRARLRAEAGVEKIVAVKILDESVGDDADLARRLRDEARILGRLQHRAIVRVEGLLRLEGRWTIAMEYVDGVDLAQVFQHGKLPGAAVLELVREVASALHHAHSATDPDGNPLRIIHRDLKPANLRVTASGDVKVLDFGVARARFEGREAETRAASYGSIGYVPPERVDGDELPAGDVFALGVVAWELLAGSRFGAGHLVARRHQATVEERLAALPKVPEPVRELLGTMLAFDPDRRPTPRDVERAAVDLLQTVKGSRRLADWCEEHLPGIARNVKRELPPGPLVGRTLIEESASGPAMEPAAPPPLPPARQPRPRRWLTVLVWMALLGLVIVVTPILLGFVLALGMYVGTVMPQR